MKKYLGILFALVLALSFSLVPSTALANDVPSSTMIFEGTLTDEGGGVYSGVIAMVDEAALTVGDSIAGYDLYAKEGATAWFGDDPDKGGSAPPIWTSVTISNNDAWPTWSPDTPDWYQYSLRLYKDGDVYKWRVANHSGATQEHPWYDAHWGGTKTDEQGVPMSGTMDWNAMYAAETDVGEYLPPIDPLTHPEIPGGAATKGGGAACWDMDWSWGSEVVPLQFPGFDVTVTALGGGDYRVTLTPAGAGVTALTVNVPDIVAISVNPTSIDFGSLIPGATSAVHDIMVDNIGTHTVDVDADLALGSAALFWDNLVLKGTAYTTRDWPGIITSLAMGGSETLKTKLPVPLDYTPLGAQTATLIFEATAK